MTSSPAPQGALDLTGATRPLSSVLIANRGEIAVRIVRACRDAGLRSIAVYSDPDADAMHVRLADEAHALPGSSSAQTYLDGAKLLEIAARAGADAVHPGYGFLSENADFAQAVLDGGLTWIGPSPQAIATLGNKVNARAIAVAAGAPLVPGTDGPAQDAAQVHAFAEEYGLPVAVKASYGGGGRGMKIARTMAEVEETYHSAVREAVAAFGRGECFAERFLDRPRHVEAQVLADEHGNIVVVGTRDCSLQRRNQKLVEESPAPFLSADQRRRIHESAREICREAGYTGAGTVEYLVAPDGLISFLEVNTRLQVEHPITEATSGVDLVLEQFRVAAGLPLSVTEDPEPRGHAFEFRINAEDPALGFLPTPGTIEAFEAPTGAGVRVDTGVRSGSTIPEHYDSLLAKLVVWGADRAQALARARVALDELVVRGVPTVVPFHQEVVRHEAFTAPDRLGVHTTWIETEFAPAFEASPYLAAAHPNAARTEVTVTLDGRAMSLGIPARLYDALLGAGHAGMPGSPAGGTDSDDADGSAEQADLTAPMNGAVVTWLADDGAQVEQGEGVVVIEAMKMETTVAAHRSGTLTRAALEAGDAVRRGDSLARIGQRSSATIGSPAP